MCPDKPIPTARAPRVAHSPRSSASYPHNIQSTVHTNHGSSFLTPQRIMPHIYLPPFRLRSTHIRSLCCSLPFCSLIFFKIGAELHLQSALTLNSLTLPSAARPGLSLLPLLFLTAPKKSLNIHFSLLFQTVLKINFKIFLLDPVI